MIQRNAAPGSSINNITLAAKTRRLPVWPNFRGANLGALAPILDIFFAVAAQGAFPSFLIGIRAKFRTLFLCDTGSECIPHKARLALTSKNAFLCATHRSFFASFRTGGTAFVKFFVLAAPVVYFFLRGFDLVLRESDLVLRSFDLVLRGSALVLLGLALMLFDAFAVIKNKSGLALAPRGATLGTIGGHRMAWTNFRTRRNAMMKFLIFGAMRGVHFVTRRFFVGGTLLF